MTRRGAHRLVKRARRAIARQDAFDWALFATLVSIGVLWRLLNVFANTQLTNGARQRFWMTDHIQSTSLLEMFVWVFGAFFILWLIALFSKWPRGFMAMQRTAELSVIVWMGFTLTMNMAVYKPGTVWEEAGRAGFFVIENHPVFSGRDFTPEYGWRDHAIFLGADEDVHKYEYPEEEIRALYFRSELEERPMPLFDWVIASEMFVGRGVTCLDWFDYQVLEQYLIRDAILATGIEPHYTLINEWAELPPKPVEPDWCPKPDDPVGGWP